MKKEHDLPRTVMKVDKFEAVSIGEARGGSELVYCCPFCSDKRAKYGKDPTPDTVGKLFINQVKEIGLCFRCNTILLINWNIESAIDKLATALELMIDKIDHKELPTLNLSTYPLASSSETAIAYIKNRNPAITEGLMDMLDLRWYERTYFKGREKISKYGILTPMKFSHNGVLEAKCFQIRFITNEKASRFYTLDGIKSIYHLRPPTVGSTITLCEGTWDAISLALMGFPNPIALLGKSISSFQADQIRHYVPCQVILALDDDGCNENLKKEVRSKLPSVARIRKYFFNGPDPEEYFTADMSRRYKMGNLGF